GYRFRLRTNFGSGIPAIIKENEIRLNAVTCRNSEKMIHAFKKTFRIRFPREVMEIDTYRVHTEVGSPAQLTVDSFRIEGFRLPHFQLINGSTWQEIGTDQPGLVAVPCVGFFTTPTLVKIGRAHV